MPPLDALPDDLLPLLRAFCVGPAGIALGGSHAKGGADARSDVDVYLFADEVRPGAFRCDLVREALGASAMPVSWGSGERFTEVGTDFRRGDVRVECWIRNRRHVQAAIAECRRGVVRREYVPWAVMGFFNYVVLADVRAMHVVEDPDGTLDRWKHETASYPEALRTTIVERFLREAAFWPENFHYRSAVERADSVYTSGIVQQVLHALVQVVFALNREYFPGEKMLVRALGVLPLQPPDFGPRVAGLVAAGEGGGVVRLRRQREALAALVEEVRTLAASAARG
jgi:predicted nucleotidyltransferase